MSDLKIHYSELGNAIQLSKDINKELEQSLKSSNELKNYLASAKWNGKTKDTFEAYLSLIRQYHDDLIDIMKDHEKALNNLKKKVDEYNSSSEVSSIKGL